MMGHDYNPNGCNKCGKVHIPTRGMLGKTISKEGRIRIGEANKCRMWSDKSRKKMSMAHKGSAFFGHNRGLCRKCGKFHASFHGHNYGDICRKCGEIHISPIGMLDKHHSEKSKCMMSEKMKGRTLSESHKQKIREHHIGFLGRSHTKETKLKIGESNRKRVWKEESKLKMSKSKMRENLSEKTLRKMSEARFHVTAYFKDTSIEVKLQVGLVDADVFFLVHYPIFGQPDVFVPPKIAIFADGDYWHTRAGAFEKDAKVNEVLRSQGYAVLRFWEHEINNDLKGCINKIISTIKLLERKVE
jgi:DNA mismatch endonuclease (patch repair protein)